MDAAIGGHADPILEAEAERLENEFFLPASPSMFDIGMDALMNNPQAPLGDHTYSVC